MVKELLEKSKAKFDDDRSIFTDAILRILDENEMLKLQYRHIRDSKIIEISYIFEELMKLQIKEKEVAINTELPRDSKRETDGTKVVAESIITPKKRVRKSTKKI